MWIKNNPAKEKRLQTKQTNKKPPKQAPIQFLDLFFFVTCPFPLNNCAGPADPGGLGREGERLSADTACKKSCQCNSSVSLWLEKLE